MSSEDIFKALILAVGCGYLGYLYWLIKHTSPTPKTGSRL